MTPLVVVCLMCALASLLLGLHHYVCAQDPSTTSTCDLGFGIPAMVSLAIAAGVASLAVVANSQDG